MQQHQKVEGRELPRGRFYDRQCRVIDSVCHAEQQNHQRQSTSYGIESLSPPRQQPTPRPSSKKGQRQLKLELPKDCSSHATNRSSSSRFKHGLVCPGTKRQQGDENEKRANEQSRDTTALLFNPKDKSRGTRGTNSKREVHVIGET